MDRWFRSRIFRRVLVYILVVSLVPLILLGALTLYSTNQAGQTAIDRSREALDFKSAEALELRAEETAQAIADFLREREVDLQAAALLPRTSEVYLAFYQTHEGELWFLEQGVEVRRMVPLYRGMAYVDATGQEVVKIVDGRVAGSDELRDVSNPANTLYKSETYFGEARELASGEVFVSRVAGSYVSKADLEAGERFTGVLRFAQPVFDQSGRFDGMVVLALDSRHLEEFTSHIVPTEERFVVASDAATGNYAYIIDDQGFPIAHPLDYHQRGLDKDGRLMSYAQRSEDLGLMPIRLDHLGFADENIPRINELALRGEEGSIQYQWEGLDKFVAYAPIPYFGGSYAAPGGFGWVGIGADVGTFHEAAMLVGETLQRTTQTLATSALVIAALTGAIVVFAAGVLARQISKPVRQLTEAVEAMEQGDLESAHLISSGIQARDELGTLSKGFAGMSLQLQETLANLERSERRYRSLFDGVPVGLYRTTPAGQFLDANLAMVQMLGYPDQESLMTVSAADLYTDAQDRVHWKTLMESAGVVRDFETQIRRCDGAVIWVRDTSRAVKDEQGQVLHYEGGMEDITERKQAEEELRKYREHLEELVAERTQQLAESERRLADIISFLPDATLVIDREGKVIAWNRAIEEMTGVKAEDMLGKGDYEYAVPFYGERRPILVDLVLLPHEEFEAKYAHIQKQGEVLIGETYVPHLRGGGLYMVGSATALRDAQGNVVGAIEIIRDITERKQAEEALRQAKEAAEEAKRVAEVANQAKSVFLANMSHELRTPLNAILGFSELMGRDPNLTRDQQENLAIIGRSGEHLLALINNVLDLAKIESGRVELHPEAFDLHHMLLGVEEMFRLRAEQKGLALISERFPDVPQYVRADQNKLRQVLINLLGNAVKFTQEGGIALRVSSSEVRVSDKDLSPIPICQLRFEVEDTGPGISQEEIDRLFEAFVQTQSGRRAGGGTGLGLPISRQFVQLMGGEMDVVSQVGYGTTFKFDVHVEVADAAAVRPERFARQVIGLEPDQPRYRILVADDKASNRQLLVKLLKPLGFELREASDGQEAVEIWEEWAPHLVWMDMRMPVMDGYEAAQRIKGTTKGQATAVIALTASVLEQDRTVILSAGCDGFMRKPFREAEIFEAMSKHLGVRYIYDEPPVSEEVSVREEALTPAALAGLPADLLEGLRQAVINLDMDLIMSLVEQIRDQDSALADALADLAHDYEYERLSTLIAEALSVRT